MITLTNNEIIKVAGAEGIEIKQSMYGLSGHGLCDATAVMAKFCNGKDRCNVKVGNELCGDPCRGKDKILITYYACGSTLKTDTTDEYHTTFISCP